MAQELKSEQMVSFTAAQFMEMIKELRKPDDETLEKKAEAAKRLELQKKQMIALAQLETATRERRQKACSHKKQDGNTLWAGQIHSDGKYHPICLRCSAEGEPMEPPRELLAQGLG